MLSNNMISVYFTLSMTVKGFFDWNFHSQGGCKTHSLTTILATRNYRVQNEQVLLSKRFLLLIIFHFFNCFFLLFFLHPFFSRPFSVNCSVQVAIPGIVPPFCRIPWFVPGTASPPITPQQTLKSPTQTPFQKICG